MKANLNFKFNYLGLQLDLKYTRLQLNMDERHLMLPFTCNARRDTRNHPENANSNMNDIKKSSPSPASHYQPSSEKEIPKTSNKIPEVEPDLSSKESTEAVRKPYLDPICSTDIPNSAPCQLSESQIMKLHIHLKHASKRSYRST